MIYEPYALDSSKHRESYAVRVGGCGGRIVARDWGLDYVRASSLCGLLQGAHDLGYAQGIEAGTATTTEIGVVHESPVAKPCARKAAA